jgi:hypothetical protein
MDDVKKDSSEGCLPGGCLPGGCLPGGGLPGGGLPESTTQRKVLTENDITFGKFKDLTLADMLKDRDYCGWLLEQDWFQRQYEYLYNRVKEYNPKKSFIKTVEGELTAENFLENYKYFNLYPLEELKIQLSEPYKVCYAFYLATIESLKNKIVTNKYANRFDIKAPTSWLMSFEKSSGLTRDMFKEFLAEHELPNIPYIVEDIKKMGGIEYKGAKSFLIAKEKSLAQEKYWEGILKERFGEDISVQYKLEKSFFDFIHLKTHTLYECKLGLKDFNLDQHNKYMLTEKLPYVSLIYLIGRDCIINIKAKTIYTTSPATYTAYIANIPVMKSPSQFDKLIQTFSIQEIGKVEDYFNTIHTITTVNC